MSTNFPVSLDTLTNPGVSDTMVSLSHKDQHGNLNDAVEALEAKVGIDSSANASSIDYRLSAIESSASVATGAEVNTGTDNTKRVTSKAIADSNVVITTKTQTLTNKTLTAPAFQGSIDGWVAANETWTYFSATAFDCTNGAIYQIGDKFKLTQTTVKYFVVTGISGNRITITGGTDYTLANAAITSPYYSRQASPLGFPVSFVFTPTANGFSSAPTSMVGSFSTIGRMVTANFYMPNTGTSNAITFSVNLPINVASVGAGVVVVGTSVGGIDNGLYVQNTVCYAVGSASTLGFGRDGGGSNWTASGNKSCSYTTITYPF